MRIRKIGEETKEAILEENRIVLGDSEKASIRELAPEIDSRLKDRYKDRDVFARLLSGGS